MATLVLCAGCERHVRTSDASCPFCALQRTATADSAPPRSSNARVVNRAVLVFAGATALGACGKETKPEPPPPAPQHDGGAVLTIYGPAPIRSDAAPPMPPSDAGGGGKK